MTTQLITAKSILESINQVVESDTYDVATIDRDPTPYSVQEFFYSLPPHLQSDVKQDIDDILVDVSFWIASIGRLPHGVSVYSSGFGGNFDYFNKGLPSPLRVEFVINKRENSIFVSLLEYADDSLGDEDEVPGVLFLYRDGDRVPYEEWEEEMRLSSNPEERRGAARAVASLNVLQEHGTMAQNLRIESMTGLFKGMKKVKYKINKLLFRIYVYNTKNGLVVLTAQRKTDNKQQDNFLRNIRVTTWLSKLNRDFEKYTVER